MSWSLDRALREASRRSVVLERILRGADCRSRGGFSRALLEGYESRGLALIAEYKRCSPRGFTSYLDPWSFARAVEPYSSAFSVLAEPYWFCGSPELVSLFSSRAPTLYKDLVAGRGQLLQAACSGASAVLLILDMLGWRGLDELYSEARGLGLEVVVETSSGRDAVEVAGSYGDSIIGVNSRDLRTLRVDFERMLSELEEARRGAPGRVLVAESGIKSSAQALEARRRGATAVLVGTGLMRNPGLAGEIARSLGPPDY